MNQELKLKLNQTAYYHKLTKADSIRLIRVYNELKTELDVIIKRDSLPAVAWFPSADFEYLIRQQEN